MLAVQSKFTRIVGCLWGVIAGAIGAAHAEPDATEAALEKANVYIETAKSTERAVDSWERYASWVSMKTGPTGKERYISYGMYDLHDSAGLLKAARAAGATDPKLEKLDALMLRYIDAYEALAPVINTASAYYDQKAYATDNMTEGKALHTRLVPLASTFLTARAAMMPELRAFARDVEQQMLEADEAREGRTGAWQIKQVLHAANRVMDVFPRTRPRELTSDEMDEQMKALGPNTPGEKFDQLISGVAPPPQKVVIDVKKFSAAVDRYQAAVATFDTFSGEPPDDFDEFKPLPRRLLDILRAFKVPLEKSQGREFSGGAQLAGQMTEAYFALLNAGSSSAASPLRYLP